MRKIYKKLIATSLIFALLLTVSACGDTGGTENTEKTTTAATTTTNTLDDDIDNPVDISQLEVENKAELENPNITYFGFYDMRVAGDIKPAVKLFEETYGGKIDYYEVAWQDRVERLTTLIASGDSPDLVDKESNSFPHFMSKNLYEDLTDHIDLSLPQWSGMEELIDSYKWNGKRYFFPFAPEASPNWLIYNNTLFEEHGIDDPRELYDRGEWDWPAFKKAMVEFVQNVPEALGGYYGLPGYEFVASAGTPLIGVENGKLVNNMSNQNVERAMLFLDELRRENLLYFGEGMWSNEPAPLVSGNAAFMGVGIWRYDTYLVDYKRTGMDFKIVPYPRDPSADAYYVSVNAFGYLVPSGSKNVEGAAAFINTIRLSKTDPELKAITDESIMRDKGRSEEQHAFISSFQDVSNFNIVNDAYAGFSQDINDIILEVYQNITYAKGDDMKTWAQLKSSYENIITDAVDSINNSM